MRYLENPVGHPNIEDWVRELNDYRVNNDLQTAGQLVWDEWNDPENVFWELLPNPDALIFSLLTYTPDKQKGLPAIAQAPQLIKWDDPPIYDTVSNYWNNIEPWNCAHWKYWHMALEAHYQSTSKANALWETAWLHSDNWCLIGYLSLGFCPITENCRYDCDFVEYLASKDLEIGNLFSNLVCDVSNVVLNIVEAGQNVSEGIKNTGKVASYALPILGVIVAGVAAKKILDS